MSNRLNEPAEHADMRARGVVTLEISSGVVDAIAAEALASDSRYLLVGRMADSLIAMAILSGTTARAKIAPAAPCSSTSVYATDWNMPFVPRPNPPERRAA